MSLAQDIINKFNEEESGQYDHKKHLANHGYKYERTYDNPSQGAHSDMYVRSEHGKRAHAVTVHRSKETGKVMGYTHVHNGKVTEMDRDRLQRHLNKTHGHPKEMSNDEYRKRYGHSRQIQ